MTSLDELGSARADPLYAEGMTSLQNGRWQDAVRIFETLLAQYPGDAAAQAALEQAQLRAKVDQSARRVRAKRFDINWRPILLRGVLIVLLVGLAFMTWRIINERIRPAQVEARVRQQQAALLRDGLALLDGDQLDLAEEKLNAFLVRDPNDAEAQAGLVRIGVRRDLIAACAEADALFEAGNLSAARESYVAASLLAGDKNEILPCDATGRIAEVNNLLTRTDLFAEAEARYSAGECVAAIDKYRQVQQFSATFERDLIAERLYHCYQRLGKAIVTLNPPAPEQLPVALDYFTDALSVRPRDPEAQTEQRLVSLYLAGQQSYEAGRWSDAATQLSAVFDSRPGYMGDTLLNPLYDALIRYGDQRRDAEDYYLAWEQYRRATSLPVDNRTLAEGRMASVQPFLTPTATPTDTPTVTPLPSATPYIPPTAAPSATPPAPLSTYLNQIVFLSNHDEQPGFWVMYPDGSNRRYLGNSGELQKQYNELRAKESYSPDGRFRVYTTVDSSRGDESEQIYYQGSDPSGVVTTKRLTNFAQMSYDPVWSPDGSRVAYVSTVDRGDDIWVLNLDDETKWNRTKLPNNVTWPWDKHPSWSPDSRKITFWTNRDGTKQIYVMDSEGRTQINLSQVEWDEYDPIWIK
jgi:tetratricopeptide (TPR) repeat protein